MASWTKRLIIEQALTEIGIASYAFDSTADQLQSALRQLDSMMGVWIDQGIVFTPDPYPISTDPTVGNLDEDTNAPANALAAMYQNLAIDLAPSYGKTVNRRTEIAAKKNYTNLLGSLTVPPEYKLGTFLLGAGNKDPLYPWSRDVIAEEEVVVVP